MTELCRLAQKFGTDKVHYTPFYSLLLERRRGLRSVLEIGIGTKSAMQHVPGYKPGASLRMWEQYFPQAHIFGMDIDPEVLFETERIHTFCADQSKPQTYIPGLSCMKFDLIVDDGSHKPEDQIATYEALRPMLRDNGVYIIEDVKDPLALRVQSGVWPYSYVQVHGALTGHCIVING